MPNLIEDRLSSLLAEWIDANCPEKFPGYIPVHVARRAEIRARLSIALNPVKPKDVTCRPHTSRLKLDVHLFSQVDVSNRSPITLHGRNHLSPVELTGVIS